MREETLKTVSTKFGIMPFYFDQSFFFYIEYTSFYLPFILDLNVARLVCQDIFGSSEDRDTVSPGLCLAASSFWL